MVFVLIESQQQLDFTFIKNNKNCVTCHINFVYFSIQQCMHTLTLDNGIATIFKNLFLHTYLHCVYTSCSDGVVGKPKLETQIEQGGSSLGPVIPK